MDRLGELMITPDISRLPQGRDEAEIAAQTWPEPIEAITPEMDLWGIHHVTGHSKDLVAAGEFYERALGAGILVEPAELRIHGVGIHLVHGHLLGARKRWKGWMESREFHRAFGLAPGPIAGVLDHVLEWKNLRSLGDDEERHLKVFRNYADGLRGRCDLVVLGHVHRAFDDGRSDPRLIVLGGWQRRSSYLQIDEGTVRFHVIDPKSPEQPGMPTTQRTDFTGQRDNI